MSPENFGEIGLRLVLSILLKWQKWTFCGIFFNKRVGKTPVKSNYLEYEKEQFSEIIKYFWKFSRGSAPGEHIVFIIFLSMF
jgi:hypothetical protein